MRRTFTLIVLLLTFSNFKSQPTNQQTELPTAIKHVTVFLQGAQVNRSGQTKLKPGRTHLKVLGLSPYLDEKSIQVKGDGDFTVLSVNHQLNFLENVEQSQAITQIQDSLRLIKEGIKVEKAKLEVLDGQMNLLKSNQSFSSRVSGLEVSTLKEAMAYFREQLNLLGLERIAANNHIQYLEGRKNVLSNQLKERNQTEEKPTSEIVIWVEAKSDVVAKFGISYATTNAGWFPNYDIRAQRVDQPIVIQYKAMVHQHTGEDWSNIDLTFSNADPSESGLAPELDPWLLVFNRKPLSKIHGISAIAENASQSSVQGTVSDEEGFGLPGVNVVVKGTTVGTVTDLNGRYDLVLPNDATVLVFSFIGFVSQEKAISSRNVDAAMATEVEYLEEVVVSGYGIQEKKSLSGSISGVRIRGANSLYGSRAATLPVTQVENQTTVEFKVAVPYTIESNGEKYKVDLATYEIPASYQYYSVPKLDKDAFLVAQIVDWDQYQLMEGEANLFFEDTFVGRTVLDTRYLSDTLSISLGRDKNVVISRDIINDFRKNKFIGGNKVDYVGWRIEARNKKSTDITLTILDQIPLPGSNNIAINQVEISDGVLDKETGEVRWKLELRAQENSVFELSYAVKYPKGRYLALE